MNDGGGGGESFFATALTFLAITRLETLATQATPPLAQARAKPQEVFSLGFFSRLWFGRVFALVFAASPLDLMPSHQTNRQLRTDTYP